MSFENLVSTFNTNGKKYVLEVDICINCNPIRHLCRKSITFLLSLILLFWLSLLTFEVQILVNNKNKELSTKKSQITILTILRLCKSEPQIPQALTFISISLS